eukprot:scaffold114286_cov63-Phaeocystis_antarctica.AAC.3
MLLRCFTQNIDSLEAATGLPREKIVAAHGNFDSAHCIDTGEAVEIEQLRTAIQAGKEGPGGWLELAELHGGLVKPDIVFFGEQASLAGPACPPIVPSHRARPSSAPPARPLTRWWSGARAAAGALLPAGGGGLPGVRPAHRDGHLAQGTALRLARRPRRQQRAAPARQPGARGRDGADARLARPRLARRAQLRGRPVPRRRVPGRLRRGHR